jgi:hypothetical protein
MTATSRLPRAPRRTSALLFLASPFLAAGFLAAGFLTAVFLTAVFLTAVFLTAVFGLLPVTECAAELKEDVERNFALDIPEGWSFDPFVPSWTKFGIVAGATHRLATLKDGQPARGEGGQAHLALTDAPPEATLDALMEDKEVRDFLLAGFEAGSGEPEVLSGEVAEGVPLRILRIDGKSRNLDNKLGPARGVMLVTIVRKKLYKLRMFAWHTEYDEEGLKGELDLIEVNWYVPNTSPLPAETAPGEGNGAPPPEEPTEMAGDSGEVKVIEDKIRGFRLTKPLKIRTKEDWDRDRWPDVVAWFEDSDRGGSYMVILTVLPKGRIVDGRAAADVDLRDWVGTKWWPEFTANHPEGPLKTFKWPRKTESGSFVTLPLFKEPIVFIEKPERRPAEVDSNDLEKLGVIEKVKGRIKMGRDKPNEAWRGSMSANRPRVGEEMVLRFAWGSARNSFELIVSITRDALVRWEAPLRELLESIELVDR